MHALEFLINGQRVCIAAPSDDGLVISNVLMTSALDAPGKHCVRFRIGGVRNDKHLEWLRRSLKLGDKVEIRVVDAPQSDPPVNIEPITDAERENRRIASNDNAA